jgi:hypothetical protein
MRRTCKGGKIDNTKNKIVLSLSYPIPINLISCGKVVYINQSKGKPDRLL